MKAEISQPIVHTLCIAIAACIAGICHQSQAASVVLIQTVDLQNRSNDLTFNRLNPAPGTLSSATTSISYTTSSCHPGFDYDADSAPTVHFPDPTEIFVDDENLVLDWSNLAGGARLLTASATRNNTSLSGITVGADTDDSPGRMGITCYRCDAPEAPNYSYAPFEYIAIRSNMIDKDDF